MSNRRRIRRNPGEPIPTLPRYPHKDPALSTVRGWLRQLEAAGGIERKGVERTGKPGRPAVLWGPAEDGQGGSVGTPGLPEPPTREEARKLLHEACRDEFGISGRQFVRQLDAGLYECGWKCRCATPHDPGLRALIRAAAWSRMSVINASSEGIVAGPAGVAGRPAPRTGSVSMSEHPEDRRGDHMSAPGPRRGVGNGVVIVCSACETESCWQGVLMCDEAQTAGTVVQEITPALEHNCRFEYCDAPTGRCPNPE